MFKYALKGGDNVLGKKSKDYAPDVTLSGVGISGRQCALNFNLEERRCMLVPNSEDPQKYSVKLNGEQVLEPVSVTHGDRILVASHHYYIYVDPLVNPDEMCEWEGAMKEANKE